MAIPLSLAGKAITWLACIGVITGVSAGSRTEADYEIARPDHPIATVTPGPSSGVWATNDPLYDEPAWHDTHDSEERIPQVPKLPEGITLDPNFDAVLNDPDRITPAPTTTVPRVTSWSQSRPDWRCDEWMELAREVGWPEEELSRLSYTIYRESRCDPTQHNPDDPMGGSNGLMQINQFWCKSTKYWPDGWLQSHGVLDSCDELYEPRVVLSAGLAIWGNSGWQPWFP